MNRRHLYPRLIILALFAAFLIWLLLGRPFVRLGELGVPLGNEPRSRALANLPTSSGPATFPTVDETPVMGTASPPDRTATPVLRICNLDRGTDKPSQYFIRDSRRPDDREALSFDVSVAANDCLDIRSRRLWDSSVTSIRISEGGQGTEHAGWVETVPADRLVRKPSPWQASTASNFDLSDGAVVRLDPAPSEPLVVSFHHVYNQRLEVCEILDPPLIEKTSRGTVTVGSTPSCHFIEEAGLGPNTVLVTPPIGYTVASVQVTPPERLVGSDLQTGQMTVMVAGEDAPKTVVDIRYVAVGMLVVCGADDFWVGDRHIRAFASCTTLTDLPVGDVAIRGAALHYVRDIGYIQVGWWSDPRKVTSTMPADRLVSMSDESSVVKIVPLSEPPTIVTLSHYGGGGGPGGAGGGCILCPQFSGAMYKTADSEAAKVLRICNLDRRTDHPTRYQVKYFPTAQGKAATVEVAVAGNSCQDVADRRIWDTAFKSIVIGEEQTQGDLLSSVDTTPLDRMKEATLPDTPPYWITPTVSVAQEDMEAGAFKWNRGLPPRLEMGYSRLPAREAGRGASATLPPKVPEEPDCWGGRCHVLINVEPPYDEPITVNFHHMSIGRLTICDTAPTIRDAVYYATRDGLKLAPQDEWLITMTPITVNGVIMGFRPYGNCDTMIVPVGEATVEYYTQGLGSGISNVEVTPPERAVRVDGQKRSARVTVVPEEWPGTTVNFRYAETGVLVVCGASEFTVLDRHTRSYPRCVTLTDLPVGEVSLADALVDRQVSPDPNRISYLWTSDHKCATPASLTLASASPPERLVDLNHWRVRVAPVTEAPTQVMFTPSSPCIAAESP